MDSNGELNRISNGQCEEIGSKLCQGLSKADLRKSNKPVMEKRRRARINRCLNELKSLILEAMKKDPARHTKLEKADILEMTVKHLQLIQRRQLTIAMQTDPTIVYKFKVGFAECTEEVKRYVSQIDGLNSGTRQRLSNYLKNCVNNLDQITTFTNFSNSYSPGTGQYTTNNLVPSTPVNPSVQNGANKYEQSYAGISESKKPGLLLSGELSVAIPNSCMNSQLENERTHEYSPVPYKQFQYTDFANNLQNLNAFNKPFNNAGFLSSKNCMNNNPFSQSSNSASPPLSPISSISSQEEDSIMHTSSDFASRSTTPTQDESQNSFRAALKCKGTGDALEAVNKNVDINKTNPNQSKACEKKTVEDNDFNANMWRPW